ncbi:MAG: T9SS type A sorting domain-containing protein [Bacteroidetes bacterium]|nr:T9SS type A sorting domain-containing protein [Bacteroidota bacterium]
MKNIKNIPNIFLLIMSLFFAIQNINAQPIAPNFFGQNAWMPDTIGTTVLGGKLHKNWSNIKDSKAVVIRFGGIAPDRDRPTNFQYIKMIDSVRAKGMEPIIQVPFHKWAYTAAQAAEIVTYINITKGRNIKYWVIGNEPDLDYAYTTAAQVAAYFKPFASAMKAVDPSILTIGPECAWFNQGIINGLTDPNGPDDITGKDAAGHYYLDIVSFHSYAFDGSQTRDQVISKLSSANSLKDNLTYLNSRLATCNTTHGRSGNSILKTAITEANVGYKNSATDDLNGTGVNSFVGGQFLAELMSVGMKGGVNFMNIWSVVEGNNTQLNIGYIDAVTGNKKPAYYHFKMMAENFKGTFISGTTNLANVKSFGSNSGQNITVMVMNQDLSNNYHYTVRLNGNAVGGTNPLKINVNAGVAVEYNDIIPAQSTMLLVFNAQGGLVKKIEYSLAQQAVANMPPVVTNFNNVATGTGENDNDLGTLKGFNVNVFPNPANSKFTVELDRKNPEEKKFEIEIFDLMGRLIYTKTSVFSERKQEIDLSGNSIAEAVYIVRVNEKEDRDNTRSEKVVIFK